MLKPVVHDWLATLSGSHVLWEDTPTVFLGRNGQGNSVGLYASPNGDTVVLNPITSQGDLARCSVEVPLGRIPALIAALLQVMAAKNPDTREVTMTFDHQEAKGAVTLRAGA